MSDTETRQLHAFRSSGGEYVFAAFDVADCWRPLEEETGEIESDFDGMTWKRLPDEKPLTLVTDSEDEGGTQTLTCAEWCRLEGRGVLGCLEA